MASWRWPCALASGIELRLYGAGLNAAPGFDTRTPVILLLTLPQAVRRRHPFIRAVLQLAGSALIRAQPPYTAIFALPLGGCSLYVYGPIPWLTLAWVLVGAASLQAFLPGVRTQVPPSVELLLAGLVAWLGGQATRSGRSVWNESASWRRRWQSPTSASGSRANCTMWSRTGSA